MSERDEAWMHERDLYARSESQQHGVFHLAQWVEAGLSRRRLHLRLERGRLLRVLPKVYALQGTRATFESRIVAGCLRSERTGGGEIGAVTAGYAGTAAARWGLMAVHSPIHIATTRKVASVPGYRFHRVALPREHVAMIEGTQVTDVPRTLLDSCGEMYWQKALRLISRAVRQDLTTLDKLERRCEEEARSGRNGVQTMRNILERIDPSVERSRSDAEDDFFDLVKALGLELPERNFLIDSGRGFPWQVDFFWPRDSVVAELDVYGTHSGFDVFHKDRNKVLDLVAAGYKVILVTDQMMKHDRARLEERLLVILGSPKARF